MSNKKKTLKAIESYEKQIEKHKEKIEDGGRKDTTVNYWNEEIKRFEAEIEKRKKKLEDKN